MEGTARQPACVFGLGWGDEGKGKLVDLLCPAFDVVVRFNGGANAGHTVRVGADTFALHLLPSGVLRPHAVGVIGPGVVLDPVILLEEIDGLSQVGVKIGANLIISDRAHLVLAYHKLEDRLSENARGAEARIGTTARGIGPCYADKMRRTSAVRAGDLLYEPALADRVRALVEQRRVLFRALYQDDGGLDADEVLHDLSIARARLGPHIQDTTAYLQNAVEKGQAILFEGANGLLLDVDHGTYPFVTSSNTGPHGIAAGAGVAPTLVPRIVGVTKAYATRVGEGPFVTELHDDNAERIRTRGKEFGTTTGRPRRCGWFDAVAARYSATLSGVTDVALMHLDTLSGFERVGICTAYRLEGEMITSFPADPGRLERAEPVFEFMPGWAEELRALRRFEDLPAPTRAYIRRIEELLAAPVSLASVGPDRCETLVRGELAQLLSASC